jgi:hypothetical protein
VGASGGGYVEFNTLARYLITQYRGMGGARIAAHKFFGRKFGALAPNVGQNGAVSVILIPVSAVKDYLRTQYRGMGGAEIASHKFFLRNCPTVGTAWPANLR